MTTTSKPPLKFYSAEEFIKKHLRFQQHWNKKHIDMKAAKWQELENDSYIAGCEYAAGSVFKVFETSNFGWIVFDKNTKTPSGHIPGKRIIKW